jgi:hypothetical protein
VSAFDTGGVQKRTTSGKVSNSAFYLPHPVSPNKQTCLTIDFDHAHRFARIAPDTQSQRFSIGSGNQAVFVLTGVHKGRLYLSTSTSSSLDKIMSCGEPFGSGLTI